MHYTPHPQSTGSNTHFSEFIWKTKGDGKLKGKINFQNLMSLPPSQVQTMLQLPLLTTPPSPPHLQALTNSKPKPKTLTISQSNSIHSQILKHNLLKFNLLIKSFSQTNPSHALHLFYQMLHSNILPDKFTLPSALIACASLRSLHLILSIHAFAAKSNLSPDPFIVSALISAYCKCGHPQYAIKLLDEISNPDLPTFNSAITGLSNQGVFESALRVFGRSRVAGLDPNQITLSGAITACGRVGDRNLGQAVHGHVVKAGEEVRDDVSVNSALVFMYHRFGNLESAELVFNSMPDRNVVSWNAMINAHAQGGNVDKAWGLFFEMQAKGLKASEVTLACMVSVSHTLIEGRMMHGFAIKVGSVKNEIIGATLIDMYTRVNNLVDARKLFDEMPSSEMGAWNSLISGYTKNGQPKEALKLFCRLRDRTNLHPNSITLVGALRACGALGLIEEGKAIHDYIVSSGVEVDLMVNTSLIDMYCKCGNMKTARDIFEGMRDKDLVAWRVMVSGYEMNGQLKEAMELFDRMRKANSLKPDESEA